MKMNYFIIGFLVLVVLVSGCAQQSNGNQSPQGDSGNGTAQNDGKDSAAEQIPTPEAPSGENNEPPNLPF